MNTTTAVSAAKQLAEWASGLWLFGSEPLQYPPALVATDTYDHLDFNCDGVRDRVIVQRFADDPPRTLIEIADPTAPAKALVRKTVGGAPARVEFQDDLGDALVSWHRTRVDAGAYVGDWVPFQGAPWFVRSVTVYADALETTAPGCYPEASIFFSLHNYNETRPDVRIVPQQEIAALEPQSDFNVSVERLVACENPETADWTCFWAQRYASSFAKYIAPTAAILLAREQDALTTLQAYVQAPRHDRATIEQALDAVVHGGVQLWSEFVETPTPAGSAIYGVLGTYYGLNRQTLERIRLELHRLPYAPQS